MDLTTRYLGLQLRNPLLAGASPLSHTVDGVRRLADAGVGAVPLYSLFEDEAERNARLANQYNETYAESVTYFPAAVQRDYGANRYLRLVERAATTVQVPVIGSLNGTTPGGWARHARLMQDAGAAAIELNVYYLPGDPHIKGPGSRAAPSRRTGTREGSGERAGGRQAEPLLQLDRRDGAGP